MSRQIQLAARPSGAVTPDHFRIVDVEVPRPREGHVVVENVVLSVDPYMRPKMDDVPSYTPPYDLGAPMDGAAVGVVVDSAAPELPVGTVVSHRSGWREHALLATQDVVTVPDLSVPLGAHLGVLGMPGMTAWVGLTRIGRLAPGDHVLVSAAAGAVGSLAGQMARLLGAAKVVGSAGSPAKVATLTEELGFDGAIDYRRSAIGPAMRSALPAGCDLYFDNVGGDHLAGALDVMNDHGRIALCGSISTYQGPGPGAMPGNVFQAVRKRLTLQGFIVSDHADDRVTFLDEVGSWLRGGQLVARETVREGIESTPSALIDLLAGKNVGKMLVRLREDPPRAGL